MSVCLTHIAQFRSLRRMTTYQSDKQPNQASHQRICVSPNLPVNVNVSLFCHTRASDFSLSVTQTTIDFFTKLATQFGFIYIRGHSHMCSFPDKKRTTIYQHGMHGTNDVNIPSVTPPPAPQFTLRHLFERATK